MKKSKIMEMCQKLVTPEIERSVEYSMFVADRIFDILDQKGMTQREFARSLNKNESEISAWLTGTHTFTTKTISKIETALGERIFALRRPTANIEAKISSAPIIIIAEKTKTGMNRYTSDYSFVQANSLVNTVPDCNELYN